MADIIAVELRAGHDYLIGGLPVDGVQMLHATLVGMTSYVTGGVTFASVFPDLMGKTIVNVMSGVGKDWTFRLLAGKLAAFVASTGVQVANAVDISTSGAVPVVIFYR
jgi:hypothetical protein